MHEDNQTSQRKRSRPSYSATTTSPSLGVVMGAPPSLPVTQCEPVVVASPRASESAGKTVKRQRGCDQGAEHRDETSSLNSETTSDAAVTPNVTLEVDDLLSERLHAVYYRQAYRMTPDHFWRLYKLLVPFFKGDDASSSAGTNKNRNTCLALKLSCALRYFAGGDSSGDHNIADAAIVEKYVWEVVDAIHACEELDITFPTADKQREVAASYELLKSDIGIPSCVGALGSMLVWVEAPISHRDPREEPLANDSGAYYNPKLNKFGLSLQAVCDHDGRFQHVSIDHPGSVSDGDAFNKSDLSRRLKCENLMAHGLTLFGGEAYAGCDYVVVPIDDPKSAEEQRFNEYHSQLTEVADASFVTLLRRWSLLRRPMPQRFGMAKQRALAMALVKLHNFCLDDTEPMLPALAKDMLYGFDRGAFVLKEPALNACTRTENADGSRPASPLKCEIVGCGGKMTSQPTIASSKLVPANKAHQQLLELVRDL